MIIDCDTCVMEDTGACADCIVPVLLAGDTGPLRIGTDEEAALRNLAEAGLVAPLRLVPRDADRGASTG
jgi:hypothetical protein